MSQIPFYDVVIIGGSFAGLSAAMTLGRSLRSALVVDAGEPCNRFASHARNLPGFDGVPPEQIAAIFREQALAYHTVTFARDTVIAVGGADEAFEVSTQGGLNIRCRKIVFATGLADILPEVEGFESLWGNRIFHCPYCHGFEFAGSHIGVWAHGDAGLEMVKLIGQWTSEISVLLDGHEPFDFGVQSKLEGKLLSSYALAISSVKPSGNGVAVTFSDGSQQQFDALYVRVGVAQPSEIAQSLGCDFDSHGIFEVDENQKSNIPGVFAVGDNATPMRSLARAIAAGNTAAMSLNSEMITYDFEKA